MSSSSISNSIIALSQHISLYACYTILVGGVIGNILNILVFTQLKLFRENRCALYLIVESIFAIVNLFTYAINNILPTVYGNDPGNSSFVWCRLRSILFQTCGLLSFSIVCFASCDQFCSTYYRVNLKRMCTLYVARRLIFVASCLSLLHSIIFAIFLDIKPSFECIVWNPTWIRYSTFFYYPVLSGLLPILISSTFSFSAYRNVRHIVRRQVPIVRRRLDRQLTGLILMRVVFFVLFLLPYVSYRIYAINVNTTQADSLTNAIHQLVKVIFVSFFNLNFASNFYIFMASSSRYRRQVKYFLVNKCWQRWKRWCRISPNQVVPAIALQTRVPDISKSGRS